MRRFLKRWFSGLLLALLVLLWLYPEQFGLAGRETRSASGAAIKVRDGDTMTIGTLDHRLHGIDAPEFSQTCKDAKGADWACGKQAHIALSSLVSGHVISCEERARDKYERVVATCTDEQGLDLGRTMIERGMAVSMGGFAEGPYADQEAEARKAKRGLWQGSFDPPASWRDTHKRGGQAGEVE